MIGMEWRVCCADRGLLMEGMESGDGTEVTTTSGRCPRYVKIAGPPRVINIRK
ncbi:hypothetical protein J6590_082254 [Homalodisca vitripennis]|nr:hypothetical protein J6590_082254 [Homalodisca vitripennis]